MNDVMDWLLLLNCLLLGFKGFFSSGEMLDVYMVDLVPPILIVLVFFEASSGVDGDAHVQEGVALVVEPVKSGGGYQLRLVRRRFGRPSSAPTVQVDWIAELVELEEEVVG